MKKRQRSSTSKSALQALALACGLLLIGGGLMAQESAWSPVTGAETLRSFMSGLEVERELPNGRVNRGEYREDGTGTLFTWGAEVPRTWEVTGDRQVCIATQRKTICYEFERSASDETLYRGRNLTSGVVSEFRVAEGAARAQSEAPDTGKEGGAAAPSAAELAAELSNPNSSLASLILKAQYRLFEGDLPETDDQSSGTLLFQPIMPFVLDSGSKIIWRPAIPILLDQPLPNADGGFSGDSGLGDIAFDLTFAPKTEGGFLLGFGLFTSLPTASDGLGSERWTLGPELLLGMASAKRVYGLFPNHQWSVGGGGEKDINVTTMQILYVEILSGGWSMGSSPAITYDWEAEQWTVPLQINVGKTVIANGRPWKLGFELNYYVEKAEAFGAEWMASFSVGPVVKNGLASWFGLGGD